MKFDATLVFLGAEAKTSKKTDKQYYMAKVMEEETKQIFDMYVPGDRLNLITDLARMPMFCSVKVAFQVDSFNGKPQVNLETITPIKKARVEE